VSGTTIFFDLETGGVEPRHPNIQLAAVAMKDGVEVESFEAKIAFAENACEPEALRLNGYSREKWVGASSEAVVACVFDEFCKRHADLELVSKRTGKPYTVARLAGHNVSAFDVPRARAMMDRAGVRFWRACWWYPLDTYARAIWHFEERGLAWPENFQLQTLARVFGIQAQGAAHEALADVRLCVLLARTLAAPL
jgi:DNA polymerase III epsilon subunit-like protein